MCRRRYHELEMVLLSFSQRQSLLHIDITEGLNISGMKPTSAYSVSTPWRISLIVTMVLLSAIYGHYAWAQATIHVPGDQPSIQAGIDASSNGDVVLVAPGTYNENIDFKGKAITVTSGATSYSGAN